MSYPLPKWKENMRGKCLFVFDGVLVNLKVNESIQLHIQIFIGKRFELEGICSLSTV